MATDWNQERPTGPIDWTDIAIAQRARQRSETCNCYVQHLLAEDKFCLRWGAHNPRCPAYRQSLDYVDNLNDEEIRNELEGKC